MTHFTSATNYSAVSPVRLNQAIGTEQHRQRVLSELKAAGMSWYGRLKRETRYLPFLIHPDEHIEAVVYGYNEDGSGMLAATDHRVIYLEKKPLFFKTDELTYDVVGGVSSGRAGPLSTVVLHTRIGDFKLRLVGVNCASHFVDFIERHCLDNPGYNNRTAWGRL